MKLLPTLKLMEYLLKMTPYLGRWVTPKPMLHDVQGEQWISLVFKNCHGQVEQIAITERGIAWFERQVEDVAFNKLKYIEGEDLRWGNKVKNMQPPSTYDEVYISNEPPDDFIKLMDASFQPIPISWIRLKEMCEKQLEEINDLRDEVDALRKEKVRLTNMLKF